LTTGRHYKLSGHICIKYKSHCCGVTIETRGCFPVPAMHNYYTVAVAIVTDKQLCCLMCIHLLHAVVDQLRNIYQILFGAVNLFLKN